VIPAAADDTAVEPNVIERAALREEVVECPVCDGVTFVVDGE